MKYYAGIGSRETPSLICRNMSRMAYMIAESGIALRSGKADGADLSFQRGLEIYNDKTGKGHAEILLPWYNWQRQYRSDWDILVTDDDIVHQAAQLCAKVHPAWFDLKSSHKLMHIRNMFQILGPKLDDPVQFVIFWAPEVNDTVQGGTASAVHLARKFAIPNFNMSGSGPLALKEFLKPLGFKYKELPKLELL